MQRNQRRKQDRLNAGPDGEDEADKEKALGNQEDDAEGDYDPVCE
jgi:hypothetical protein